MKNFSSPGQPNRLRKPSLALIALLVLVLALLVFNLVYLATDLAPRIGRVRRSRRRDGMDIRIGRIGFERHHQSVEVAGHNILPRDRLDVSLGPCPGDCSAIRGTGLWSRPRPGKRQVRAEEHKDAAGIAGLTKMNVSLRHRARLRRRGSDVRVGKLLRAGTTRRHGGNGSGKDGPRQHGMTVHDCLP